MGQAIFLYFNSVQGQMASSKISIACCRSDLDCSISNPPVPAFMASVPQYQWVCRLHVIEQLCARSEDSPGHLPFSVYSLPSQSSPDWRTKYCERQGQGVWRYQQHCFLLKHLGHIWEKFLEANGTCISLAQLLTVEYGLPWLPITKCCVFSYDKKTCCGQFAQLWVVLSEMSQGDINRYCTEFGIKHGCLRKPKDYR